MNLQQEQRANLVRTRIESDITSLQIELHIKAKALSRNTAIQNIAQIASKLFEDEIAFEPITITTPPSKVSRIRTLLTAKQTDELELYGRQEQTSGLHIRSVFRTMSTTPPHYEPLLDKVISNHKHMHVQDLVITPDLYFATSAAPESSARVVSDGFNYSRLNDSITRAEKTDAIHLSSDDLQPLHELPSPERALARLIQHVNCDLNAEYQRTDLEVREQDGGIEFLRSRLVNM